MAETINRFPNSTPDFATEASKKLAGLLPGGRGRWKG